MNFFQKPATTSIGRKGYRERSDTITGLWRLLEAKRN